MRRLGTALGPVAGIVLAVAAGIGGCTCRLSGTPLDTMEKRLNPACWFTGDGGDARAEPARDSLDSPDPPATLPPHP